MEKTWLSFIENPNGLTAVFGEDVPSSLNMRLKEIIFSHDGPAIIVKMDLENYPAKPPPKWEKDRYDVVALELRFLETSSIEVKNWSTDNIASMLLTKQLDFIQVEFPAIITFKTKWIILSSISGYLEDKT